MAFFNVELAFDLLANILVIRRTVNEARFLMPVRTKCIYEPKSKGDGYRVLVMRFWPRGMSKDKIDIWAKDLGTPPDLIKKWKSGRIRWAEFSKQYRTFAAQHKDEIDELALKAKKETVTLLCSCRDGKHCHRALLKELIN